MWQESHTAALAEIDEALSAGDNEELQELRAELQDALKAAQTSLLQVKYGADPVNIWESFWVFIRAPPGKVESHLHRGRYRE